ncbi:MAG: hypothetical protein AB1896_10930 [Thermodesulfobacteriota bacterium]
MPRITREGPTKIAVDFADMTEVDVTRILDHYLPEKDSPVSIYELHRILVEGVMYEVRNDQAGVDGYNCDSVVGDLPCGNTADFVMEDGTRICFECYRIYLQRFGERTGKKFNEIP